ncbi:MAG: hypothetical protein QOG75_1660 [Mycobacterium sp.]|nr:hypothetical protein [Mycobacterium sp.]
MAAIRIADWRAARLRDPLTGTAQLAGRGHLFETRAIPLVWATGPPLTANTRAGPYRSDYAATGSRTSAAVAVRRASVPRFDLCGQCAARLGVGKLVGYDDAAVGWCVGASDFAAICTVPAPRLTAPEIP